MNESATYSVILSGNLRSGFELDSVVEAFARLFRTTPENAGRIVGTEFVVKREVDLQMAKAYKDRLSDIGVEVTLKREGNELALEPVETAEEEAGEAPLGDDEMICPKCEMRQARADDCSGCGIIIAKFMERAAVSGAVPVASAAAAPAAVPMARAEASGDDDAEIMSVVEVDEGFGIAALIAPVIAAVLGAFLWYAIAIHLEYEFGAIAWLIGGAIGFAALVSGARGEAVGALCGVLALLSIFGGKYMSISEQQAEFAALLSSEMVVDSIEMREFYEEEMTDARLYSRLDGDEASLRQFMVERQYSEFSSPTQVSDEEMDIFLEYTAPRLIDIAANRPSFDEWRDNNLGQSIADMSTLDLLVDSLTWIDLLFVLFGVGTAFRLASQGRSS